MRPTVALLATLPACHPVGTGRSPDTAGPGDTAPIPSADSGVEEVPDAWSPPSFDPDEVPADISTVEIVITSEAMARLDADPYHAPDEAGTFVDDDGRRTTVDLCYRGAYELQSVMATYDLRNWKVKFPADAPYQGHREWNFNYEPDFRQELAYDLFRFAGVPVPEARHVILRLNGVYQGAYLQYEDPDDKAWLWESFGDDDGDLYKGAYDLPGEPQCFADLTVLGPTDEAYACHYTKKTNDEVDPGDYAVLRAFVEGLNGTPEADLPAWVESELAVEAWLSYLVVSNFIANWDSYPQRPKNFWLYQDLRADRVVFLPWDLNATFDPTVDGTYNQMGTTASVLFDLVENDYEPVHEPEGTERPLVRRLFAEDTYLEAYLDRYRALTATILSEEYLMARLDAHSAVLEPAISSTDRGRLAAENAAVRTFIRQRCEHVRQELEAMPPRP